MVFMLARKEPLPGMSDELFSFHLRTYCLCFVGIFVWNFVPFSFSADEVGSIW